MRPGYSRPHYPELAHEEEVIRLPHYIEGALGAAEELGELLDISRLESGKLDVNMRWICGARCSGPCKC
ncbi:hypothetical protein P4S72_11415 [Vibrio sp. PP-XX7]